MRFFAPKILDDGTAAEEGDAASLSSSSNGGDHHVPEVDGSSGCRLK